MTTPVLASTISHAGELAPLVAVEDLRRAIVLERLVQGLDAEVRIERVGQAPGQHRAARPIHHGDQVQKAPLQGDVGDIRAPHVVRPRDRQIAEQVGIDPVRRVRLRRPGPLEERVHPQPSHQAAHPLARDRLALAAEPACHLARSVERRLEELLVDPPHQAQIQRAFAPARVVERRPRDRHQPALPRDAEPRVLWVDHRHPSAGLECEEIVVELVDGDQIVASSAPEAQWLPGDVLAIRRDRKLSYGCLASAAQAMLDRQDLLKDLRLVLDALASLAGQETPTSDQVEAAMERAEIDAQAIAYVRNQWAGANSFVADRIRPVLVLLQIPSEELYAATTDIDRLTEWLSSNLRQWPAMDLLAAARRSRDDRAMGEAAWRALGDVAQLPSWNEALTVLGDRYVVVENRDVDEETAAHLEAAAPLLRGFARYVVLPSSSVGEESLSPNHPNTSSRF